MAGRITGGWWKERALDAVDALELDGHLIRRLRARVEELETERAQLISAIVLTQEHVHLPPIPGWAWYDTLSALDPMQAERLKAEHPKEATSPESLRTAVMRLPPVIKDPGRKPIRRKGSKR